MKKKDEQKASKFKAKKIRLKKETLKDLESKSDVKGGIIPGDDFYPGRTGRKCGR